MKKTYGGTYALLCACAFLLCAAGDGLAGAGGGPAAAVAGTYRYKTYRPGREGYDNTLEIEDKGRGRLRVTLSGTYLYQANGAETFHEASGEGDASLRGSVATASVTPDGGDGPCRVVITFGGDKAQVKASSDCGFNVDLNGTYVKEKGDARPAA